MKMTIAAIVVGLASAGSVAQAQTYDANGFSALNDRIDDIQTDVADDMARSQDASRFGNPEFRPGLSGSASLGYAGQTGNSESQEFSAGARLRYASGQFVQTIGLALDFADDAGTKTKEDVFAVYDANYYFNDKFYGFILGRVESDGLATTADDISTDAFLGFGPGYRIINTEKMTWRVQAGIGQSYLEDGTGASNSELGYIASSRLFYAFNPNIFASNDTDILKTNDSLRINNDLGVNFKVTDALATRISYLTEYNDSRAIRADNRLGVSLVFGF
jgi:putative salt-induced outer membrane protein